MERNNSEDFVWVIDEEGWYQTERPLTKYSVQPNDRPAINSGLTSEQMRNILRAAIKLSTLAGENGSSEPMSLEAVATAMEAVEQLAGKSEQ